MVEAGRDLEKERAVARHLLDEHAGRVPYVALSGELALSDIAEAYRVQEAFVSMRQERSGASIAGYKIALTSAAMQAFVGVDHPLLGAIFDDTVVPSPAEVSLAGFRHGASGQFTIALNSSWRCGLAARSLPDLTMRRRSRHS